MSSSFELSTHSLAITVLCNTRFYIIAKLAEWHCKVGYIKNVMQFTFCHTVVDSSALVDVGGLAQFWPSRCAFSVRRGDER